MQYESIILELMTRIKNLEIELAATKETVNKLEQAVLSVHEDSFDDHSTRTTSYGKTTDAMLNICYAYGKHAYFSTDANIGELADSASAESGMNRNSAFMYIYAVKSMLEGVVFKRTINKKALRLYLNSIHQEFGKSGLSKALAATRAYVQYLQEKNIPHESAQQICEEFAGLL